MNISRSEAGSIDIQQFEYVSKMTLVPEDASFALFRSCRAALAWVTHSRPDLCFAVNQAAQVTETHFDINDVRSLNKAIQFGKKSQISLRFGMLHEKSLHIRVYADASFGTIGDFTSQIGFIISLCNKNNQSHILDYSSRKSKRVVRSILGADLYAFSDGFDAAYMIRHDLQVLFRRKIPLKCSPILNSFSM